MGHVSSAVILQPWNTVRPQRVINGIMNRLSEETLEPVTARLRDAYRGHSTTETSEALWMATRAVCVHDKHVSAQCQREASCFALSEATILEGSEGRGRVVFWEGNLPGPKKRRWEPAGSDTICQYA